MKTINVNERSYKWPSAPTVVVCIDGSEPDYIEQTVPLIISRPLDSGAARSGLRNFDAFDLALNHVHSF